MRRKFWKTLFIIILLIVAISFHQTKAIGQENEEPTIIVASITGLSAKIPLSNVTFSIELIGERVITSDVVIGQILSGEQIKAETTLTLPTTSEFQNLSFNVNLLDNKMMLFEGAGLITIENMESYWTFLRFNASAIKSESDAKLTFSSIGIIGTIEVKVSVYSNVSSLIAVLAWKNETMEQIIEMPNMEFVFANLTSNIPQISFELKVLTNETIGIVHAIGKLQVTAEKVYMPISVNQWSRQHLSGWNITFICQKYATITELPIHISSVGSKVLATPGSYTADFRENATQNMTEKTPTSNQNLIDQILGILLAPTSLILIAVLAGLTIIICAIKLKRRG
jgi:hypothetical protein